MALFYNKWKIRVNAAKSESMVVTRRRRYTNDSPLPLTMHGCTIPSRAHVKNLGVEFQCNNKFNHHCQIQVWGDEVCQSTFKKLKAFQNKCLRLALNLRPHPEPYRQIPNVIVHTIANVPTLDSFKQKLKENFVTKAALHTNPLISQLSRH